jgi:hypothetical protein
MTFEESQAQFNTAGLAIEEVILAGLNRVDPVTPMQISGCAYVLMCYGILCLATAFDMAPDENTVMDLHARFLRAFFRYKDSQEFKREQSGEGGEA